MSTPIALSLIDPSPTQPRTAFRKIDELADSIRALGVRDSIKVRERASRYELIDGERRCRAAKVAGLKEIPAEIIEMSDEEVIFEQLALNDSELLTPLEEAGAYRRLIDTYGRTVEEIAADAGVAKSVVWARLRLTYLIPALRALVDAERLSQAAAQLVALEPNDVQELIADDIAVVYPTGKLTRDDVRNLLDRHVRRLEVAPFDRTDASLSELGACEGCVHSTATQRALFPDETDEALCTNGPCWTGKVDKAWDARRQEAERMGLRVLDESEAALTLDGARVRPGVPWVDVDEPIAPETMQTWTEFEKELAESDSDGEGYDVARCAVVRAGDRFLTLLDAPYAAGYIAQSYPERARELRGEQPQGVVDDRERTRLKKEHALAEAEVHDEACAQFCAALIGAPKTEKEREAFVALRTRIIRDMVARAARSEGQDVAKAVAKRRSFQMKNHDGAPLTGVEIIAREAADMDINALSLLVMEVHLRGSLMDETTSKEGESMLDAVKVSLPTIRKEKKRSKRNVRTRTKKSDAVEAQAE